MGVTRRRIERSTTFVGGRGGIWGVGIPNGIRELESLGDQLGRNRTWTLEKWGANRRVHVCVMQ